MQLHHFFNSVELREPGVVRVVAPLPDHTVNDPSRYRLCVNGEPLPTQARKLDNFNNYELQAVSPEAVFRGALTSSFLGPLEGGPDYSESKAPNRTFKIRFGGVLGASSLIGNGGDSLGHINFYANTKGPKTKPVADGVVYREVETFESKHGVSCWTNSRSYHGSDLVCLDVEVSIGNIDEPTSDLLFKTLSIVLPKGWKAFPVIPLRCHDQDGDEFTWLPWLAGEKPFHTLMQYRAYHIRIVVASPMYHQAAQQLAADAGFGCASDDGPFSWWELETPTFTMERQPIPALTPTLRQQLKLEQDTLHAAYLEGIKTGGSVPGIFGQGGYEIAEGAFRVYNPDWGGATSGLDLGLGTHVDRAYPELIRRGLFLSRVEHYWEMTSRPSLMLTNTEGVFITPEALRQWYEINPDDCNTELMPGEQNTEKVHVHTDPFGFQGYFTLDRDDLCEYCPDIRRRGGIDEEHGGRFRKDCVFMANCGDRIAIRHLQARAAMLMLSEPTRYDLDNIGEHHTGADCGREDGWSINLIACAERYAVYEDPFKSEKPFYLSKAIQWLGAVATQYGHHERRHRTKYSQDLAYGEQNYHWLGQSGQLEEYDPSAEGPPFDERVGINQAWEEVIIGGGLMAAWAVLPAWMQTESLHALNGVISCVKANLWAWDDEVGAPKSHYAIARTPGGELFETQDEQERWEWRDHDGWYLPALVVNGIFAAYFLGSSDPIARKFASELASKYCNGLSLESKAAQGGTLSLNAKAQLYWLSEHFTIEQIENWGAITQ